MTSRLLPLLLLTATGCLASHQPTMPSSLGTPTPGARLLAVIDEPGPLTVETVVSADWEVDLAGLLNLDHPEAVAAGLEDRPEKIQIYFHVIRHPTHGTFLVDSGVAKAYRDTPDDLPVSSLVKSAMHLDKLVVRTALGDWLAKEPAPVAGVFLTHMHLDHVMGLRDLPATTPIHVGAGEAQARGFLNLFVNGTVDAQLEGKGPLREWQFQPEAGGPVDGALDVFGDGSLWALPVPGHTAGSAAYLARTADGPVLLVGDTCHTAWGWKHGVEPGSFTADQGQNAVSLAKLRELAGSHPAMKIRLGHQPLEP